MTTSTPQVSPLMSNTATDFVAQLGTSPSTSQCNGQLFINRFKNQSMKFKLYSVLVSLLITCLSITGSNAQVNPFAPARNFVIFVENDMTVYGKENKVNNANGGNFIMAGPSGYNTGSNGVGDYFAGADPLPTSTYIGGKLLSPAGGTLKIQGNAYFKIGNLTGSSCSLNGKTTEITQNGNKILYSDNSQTCSNVSQMGDLNIPAAFAQMRATNQCLAGKADNVTWNSAGFVDVSANRYNYLTLTVAQLDSTWKLTTNSDANHFLVINVRGNGTPVHLVNGGFDTKGDPRYDMINITNIPALYFDKMQTNFKFSILAPDTDGYFDDKEQHGQLVFKNYEQTDKIYQHGVPYEGEIDCQTVNTIGDFVFDDNANTTPTQNGIQDPNEPGIKNVTVTLFTCGGTLVTSTTTNASGYYSFTNVPAGSYKIRFSNLPTGYLFTQKDAGSNDSKDSDVDLSGNTDCFTIVAGQTKLDVDAGAFAGGGVQPITITQFNGKYENGVSKLNWTLTAEDEVKFYDVQRGTDGTTFKSIGQVKSLGGTLATTKTYQDNQVLAGANYYRLGIVDKGGNYTYSKIILINAAVKGISITSISPNPFVQSIKVNVVTENTTAVTVRVLDHSGRILKSQFVISQRGSNSISINDLGSLAKGIYLVEVKAGEQSKTIKLMKD